MNRDLALSFNARKALRVQIGEENGQEIADLLTRLAAQIEELNRCKVNITHVVPMVPSREQLDLRVFGTTVDSQDLNDADFQASFIRPLIDNDRFE